AAGVLASVYAAADRGGSARSMVQLNEVLNILSGHYVDEIPPEDLVKEAVDGLVESLDPHSQLLDKRYRRRLMEQTRGEFGGIGIEISIREDSLTVLAPIPGTPASRVGLQAGDRIVRIEHEPTYRMKLDDAVKRLKGKPGTKVNIWVHRMGVDEDIHFEITRAIIKIVSIQAKFMVTPGTGYIRLGVFSEKSAAELIRAVEELKAQGMGKLIFDLRDNPGGLLSRAVDVADVFLEPGQVVVSTRGRIRSSNRLFRARRAPLWSGGPVIAIISGGSASASEIVSGALQDHDKAVIVGSTSYGKASVQTIIDLRDEYALKLTTAKYYTPSGRCIHADRGAGEDHQTLLSAEDTLSSYQTDSGRMVHGGGGITPDLIFKPDSLTGAERKIFRKVGLFRSLMFRYAVQYKNGFDTPLDSVDAVPYRKDFRKNLIEITPEMVDESRRMMKDEGFDLTDAEFDQVEKVIRQWMSYYIADACYDRNTAQRVLADFDDQLLKAVQLMEEAPAEGNFVEAVLAGRTLPDTLYLSDISRH
ncbi:MAG: S41 family peptidase, partial [Gemmatimonadota bacterium]|nr:S41 family peptidase [Gemmatimonadota bacterium]